MCPGRSDQDGFDERIGRIAALGEPIRRALYRYVVAQPTPVGREQAASAVGVPHHVAKFHLDKLATDGLLEVDYARPAGHGGPGAGRPAKRYRRSSREVAVSLPERRYDLVGRVLAEAIRTAADRGTPLDRALSDAAANAGRALGAQANGRLGGRPSPSACRRAVTDVLTECGYEPQQDSAGITLANCPFHSLAVDYTDLVCGTNRDLINGLLGSFTPAGLKARLDPAEGRCCVTLDRTAD
jgi:predicted ArsR family transcriptional regulator